MNELERNNLAQIEALNQRGGRTLSIVDMINADTLSVEMAAYMFRAVAEGASLLTAAGPGGAGKSTLLANLLNFLPPGTRIVTTPSGEAVRSFIGRQTDGPTCFLVHEIGSGPWYAYIWGTDVADFFRLSGPDRRVAACIHADEYDELKGILTSPPLSVAEDDFAKVGLLAFMHVSGSWGRMKRRVSAVHDSPRGDSPGKHADHQQVFTWTPKKDSFPATEHCQAGEPLAPYRRFVESLLADGVSFFEDVRRRVCAFYGE